MELRTARIIIAAYIASVFIYAGITYAVPAQASAKNLAQLLLWIFTALSAGCFILGPRLGRLALSRPTSSLPRDIPTSPFMRATIIIAAFGETIAVFGLVLFFLSGQRLWFWPFAAVSVVYLLMLLMRLDELHQEAQAVLSEDGIINKDC
jgi:hypothetical protein